MDSNLQIFKFYVDRVFSVLRYLLWFSRYQGSRNVKNHPLPQIMGKYWSHYTGQGRFLIRGQLQHTPKFSFKSVYLFVRYSLANFFAQTDRGTDRHTHTRQAKNQFSLRFSVSRVRKCAKLNFELLTVFQYFHSFYEHRSKNRVPRYF